MGVTRELRFLTGWHTLLTPYPLPVASGNENVCSLNYCFQLKSGVSFSSFPPTLEIPICLKV